MSAQGEGSRGGNIVGHTKSGFAIYGSPHVRTIAKGVGLIAGGAAFSILGGKASGMLVRRAAHMENYSHLVLDANHGRTFRKASNLAYAAALKLREGTGIAGGAIAGAGIGKVANQINPHTKDNKYADQGATALGAVGGGVVGAFGARLGFYHEFATSKRTITAAVHSAGKLKKPL